MDAKTEAKTTEAKTTNYTGWQSDVIVDGSPRAPKSQRP